MSTCSAIIKFQLLPRRWVLSVMGVKLLLRQSKTTKANLIRLLNNSFCPKSSKRQKKRWSWPRGRKLRNKASLIALVWGRRQWRPFPNSRFYSWSILRTCNSLKLKASWAHSSSIRSTPTKWIKRPISIMPMARKISILRISRLIGKFRSLAIQIFWTSKTAWAKI